MELKEGEVVCDQCHGTGLWAKFYNGGDDIWCDKCQGTGKLDWLERIVGKRPPDVYITKIKLDPKTREIDAKWEFEWN